jgi:hypothetical protein
MGETFRGRKWPQELLDKLMKLHGEGLGSEEIAKQLGMSRGQIMGMTWRLDLKFQRQPYSGPFKPITEYQRIKRDEGRRLWLERKREMKMVLLKKLDEQIDTKIRECDIHGLTSFRGEPTNCRAILHGEGIDAIYCGKRVFKRSYCEDHFKDFYYRSYSMPIPRR